MQNVAILGATGSIGKSTLDVLELYPDKIRLYAVTAHSRVKELAEIAKRFNVSLAVTSDPSKLEALKEALAAIGCNARAEAGAEAVARLAASPEVDIVVGAIVGAAGIVSTFRAAEAGKKLLLANKESVVCGGKLLMDTVKRCGATLMPVDSEHNAIFQCLVGETERSREKARIILTASGGPFRTRKDLSDVTIEEATHHPNWSMGRKITVDSATLMNKGLEVIEARWLFDFPPERIDVVVHPQSIIHSMVEYEDGVVIAQMGAPDMKNTIAYSLAYPDRFTAGVTPLKFSQIKTLTFEDPDLNRFPQLGYAYEALKMGGSASIVLNAANEIGVEAFLEGRIGFTDIAVLCRSMMYGFQPPAPTTLEEILETDRQARELARAWADGYSEHRRDKN